MKIGVLSDTHIPVSAGKLPSQIKDFFKDCDLIIHAGDLVEKSVMDDLRKIAETKAVYGNMDSPELKKSLPEKIIFKAVGKSIGVIHGKGWGTGTVKSVKKVFKEKLDIVIFGHSHVPFNEVIDGTLFFNPGSATDRVFAPYRSFGMIRIEGDNIEGEIIRIND